jgi:hypothetical protein
MTCSLNRVIPSKIGFKLCESQVCSRALEYSKDIVTFTELVVIWPQRLVDTKFYHVA